MQTRSKVFDDLGQLFTNAAGLAHGVREEAETAMRGWFERWISESNLVTREENDSLRTRIEALEAKQSGG